MLAFVDFLFYFFKGGVAAAKKQDNKKEGLFKRALVFFAGLITFGITTEPAKQSVDEPRQEQQKQKQSEKTMEQPTAKEEETGQPQEAANQNFASDQQKKVAELMKNGSDFLLLAGDYYNFLGGQKSQTWDNFIYN
ncbi:hypothetical protein [Parageobacillus sp. KH3-4]|uniref:hypothetical protein n=1 Tax=Parageobacillus sp. KH3-4 TaxID=2916802 RepID=UPI001FCB7A2D|nr:hypothetical protein [Parageobacillus sp. KH3-4]BDG47952.1 hypothetical protein PspKH34_25130 [Parageobacillus sp. KH3-4]